MNGPLSGAAPTYDAEGRLQRALRDLLLQSNGAFAFGGAFLLLPSGPSDASWSMEEVNAGQWKSAYPQDVQGAWCFALDALGHPFCIRGEAISRLDLETGLLTDLSGRFGEFLGLVEEYPDALAFLDVFEKWTALHGCPGLKNRLVPMVPAIMGGSLDAGGLYAEDLMRVLDYHAHIYAQTKDLEDGARVRFEIKP